MYSANIIDNLINRIETYRLEKKNPCKNYATKEAAEKAVAIIAQQVANHHAIKGEQQMAQYIVIYNEAWGRWVAAVNLTELLARNTSTGGFLGYCATKGFYTF